MFNWSVSVFTVAPNGDVSDRQQQDKHVKTQAVPSRPLQYRTLVI